MSQKPEKRKSFFGFAARLNAIVVCFVFTFYLLLGIMGGPSLLLFDMQNKLVWASTKISTYILGLPDKPVVAIETGCVSTMLPPYVRLSWDFTEATISYDIERDNQPLVQGLIVRNYQDDVVQNSTQYSYVVIAIGLMGLAASDPVTITTKDCTIDPPKPDPMAEIITFDGRNIATYGDNIETRNLRPDFTGISNIPSADIEIILTGTQPQFATAKANDNGFWSWSPPSNLIPGDYVFRIKLIDPEDNERFIEKILPFRILVEVILPPVIPDNEDDDSNRKKKKIDETMKNLLPRKPIASKGVENPRTRPQSPIADPNIFAKLRIGFEVKNPNKIVYQGHFLNGQINMKVSDRDLKKADLEYQILKTDGTIVYNFFEEQKIFQGSFLKNIRIPGSIETGNYKIRVVARTGSIITNGEDWFRLRAEPIASLSTGVDISYADLIAKTGWMLLWLLLLLLIIFILFGIEHSLSLRALFHPTGIEFETNGMLTKNYRKEVKK